MSWAGLIGAGTLAKAAPVLDSGWRYIGGASIVFHAAKTFLFGKTIRTIEYPDGDLYTVTIRTNTPNSLKAAIIRAQPPLYPGVELHEDEVKQLVRWTPPHFTEPILTRRDLKLVPDGGWVFWSRFEEEIPRRGVVLELKIKDEMQIDFALRYVEALSKSLNVEERLSRQVEELLTDLLVDKDDGVLILYRNFHTNPALFKRHVMRYLKRKGMLSDTLPSVTVVPGLKQLTSQTAEQQRIEQEAKAHRAAEEERARLQKEEEEYERDRLRREIAAQLAEEQDTQQQEELQDKKWGEGLPNLARRVPQSVQPAPQTGLVRPLPPSSTLPCVITVPVPLALALSREPPQRDPNEPKIIL